MFKKAKNLKMRTKEALYCLAANEDGDLGELVWKLILAAVALAIGIALYTFMPDQITTLFTSLITKIKSSLGLS